VGCSTLSLAALGIGVCAAAPEKKLEQNVAQAGGETNALAQENKTLKTQLEELTRTTDGLRAEKDSLLAANKQSREETAKTISELNQTLLALQKNRDDEKAASEEAQRRLKAEIQNQEQSLASLRASIDSEKAVGKQVDEMERKARELGQTCDVLQKQLAQAKAQDEERKKDVSAKITQIDALTKQLTAVNQQREAMQGILQGIGQATDRFSQQLSSVKPDALAPSVMAMTQEMKSLSLSEAALGVKASELGEAAALMSKVQTSLNKMLEQVVTVLAATTDDQSKERKFVDSLREENTKLSTNVAALKSEMQRLEDEQVTIKETNAQLVETNSKLSDLADILKQPNIAEIIQAAIAQASGQSPQ
jgi:chromosome segregation ATPase